MRSGVGEGVENYITVKTNVTGVTILKIMSETSGKLQIKNGRKCTQSLTLWETLFTALLF